MYKPWRSLVLLFGVLLFFIAACTLRVEKIKPFDINSQHFEYDKSLGSWQDSVFLMCCNGTISTPSGTFEKGRYEVTIIARGSQAYHIYPKPKVMLNGQLLQEVPLDSAFTTYKIPFSLEKRDEVRIGVQFDQDGVDDKDNDRNIWIRKILVDTAGH